MADNPVISVRRLSFTYPNGLRALEGISLAVNAGESVGLIGSNGAGKTTLYLCLSGVLPVLKNTIMIGGLDPADRQQRRSHPCGVRLRSR